MITPRISWSDLPDPNRRLDQARRTYPNIPFTRSAMTDQLDRVQYYWSIPPDHPARISVWLPPGRIFVQWWTRTDNPPDKNGKTVRPVRHEKLLAHIDDNHQLPRWGRNRKPPLYVRDGRVHGNPEDIVIALTDGWLDPILTNYDLREVRDYLIELNQSE